MCYDDSMCVMVFHGCDDMIAYIIDPSGCHLQYTQIGPCLASLITAGRGSRIGSTSGRSFDNVVLHHCGHQRRPGSSTGMTAADCEVLDILRVAVQGEIEGGSGGEYAALGAIRGHPHHGIPSRTRTLQRRSHRHQRVRTALTGVSTRSVSLSGDGE